MEQDFEQAVHWWQKAAEQGHARAQFRLGEAYANGEGVEADLTEAYAWFILARAGGVDVNEILEGLRDQMPPGEIAAAQELALEIQGRIEARKAEQE